MARISSSAMLSRGRSEPRREGGERFLAARGRPASMFTPGGVDRWVSFELGRINDGLVVERKSLAALRREARPACRTRSGDEHLFDRQVLERLAGLLTADEAGALRMPLTLIASGGLRDSVLLSDPPR